MSNSAYVKSVLKQRFELLRDGQTQNELVDLMARLIRQLPQSGIKTVSVIGGAASGKSSIAEELVAYLQKKGTATDLLCTDNYVIGDRRYRQEDLQNADAEEKYDFKLMDKHVAAIRALKQDDQSVTVPLFDDETGKAVDDKSNFTYEVHKLDILIIEGDFPRDDYDMRFFLQVPDDKRLENNLQRETESRDDTDEAELIKTFNDRQRTIHKPYTLPALEKSDYVIVADVAHNDWLFDTYRRTKH